MIMSLSSAIETLFNTYIYIQICDTNIVIYMHTHTVSEPCKKNKKQIKKERTVIAITKIQLHERHMK